MLYSLARQACNDAGVHRAAEAREAEARIQEAQQKHQELESEREALRHKAQETRAAEQVRCQQCP